eukprot:jgi/Undpi1/13092/HiC_scaffold_8.g02754.m1
MGAEVITYLEDVSEIQRTTTGEIVPSTDRLSSLGHSFTYGVVGGIFDKKKCYPCRQLGDWVGANVAMVMQLQKAVNMARLQGPKAWHDRVKATIRRQFCVFLVMSFGYNAAVGVLELTQIGRWTPIIPFTVMSLEGIGGLVATVHFTRPTPENFSSPVATMVQKLCTSQNLPRVFSGNRSTFSPRAPSGKKATLSPRQKSPFSPGGKKMLLLPSITAKVSTREGSDDASPTPTVAEAWAADNEKQCVFFTRQGAKVVPTTLSADSF